MRDLGNFMLVTSKKVKYRKITLTPHIRLQEAFWEKSFLRKVLIILHNLLKSTACLDLVKFFIITFYVKET